MVFERKPFTAHDAIFSGSNVTLTSLKIFNISFDTFAPLTDMKKIFRKTYNKHVCNNNLQTQNKYLINGISEEEWIQNVEAL